MSKTQHYKNWHVETKEHIVWIYFDRANSAVNTINHEVLDELAAILTDIAQQKAHLGVIIASAKSSGFIAGADVEQFTKFKTLDEAMALINKGQQVFNQLAAMQIPTVAMIKGFCLGGGCELALACRYRVADDDAKTRIGLPEILLGIHPGWGGSVRLPRMIGAIKAMDLILTGRLVTGKDAARLGFVDIAVPERQLERAARYCVLNHPKSTHPTRLEAVTNNPLARPIIAAFLRKKVAEKANPEHYPAPYAVIENWLKVGVDDEQQALQVEAESVGKIALTDTAHNLIRDFFLQETLKGLGKEVEFVALHVHVVGAGTMGGDIAAWCALRGFRVTLQDRGPEYIAPAIKRANELFKKKLKQPRLVQAAMDRLIPDPTGLGIARADVIIEAIFENLEAKRKLFKEIELVAKPEAILATNTSSIPLDEINIVLRKPERLVGIHFFNPVAKMQLVEVVQSKVFASELVKKSLAFVRNIDRLPLPVKSSPGFLVNRVLMPYLMEAMLLLDEGVPAFLIDEAAINFGMPMGPVELADTVGLDVCLAVAKNLSAHFGGTVSNKLEQMVKEGLLGRKSGHGFYVYRNGKAVKEKKAAEQNHDIAERLILRMINEAVACLREGVVADSDLIDAGMIFGTGFAPFRGGPMHYAETVGFQNICNQLQQLAEQYGDRFKPDAGWKTLLDANKTKIKSVKHTAAEV